MKVSVMLPARDAAETLPRAARSCLEQTFEDLELLLLANDTTPETREVMEGLRREDGRVRIVETLPGAGFVAALNGGWRTAKGTYLARMDADDWAYPDRLECQVDWLDGHPDAVGCGSWVQILRRDAEGILRPPQQGYAAFERWLCSFHSPEELYRERFVDSPIVNPSMMVRADLFENVGGYRDEGWAEDYDFWLRVWEWGGPQCLGIIPEVMLDWIDSDTRLTRHHERYRMTSFLAAKVHFLARLPQVRSHGVIVCGAGPTGKRIAHGLRQQRVKVAAFLEVSERRIGQAIGGVPVHASAWIRDHWKGEVVLAAAGQPGRRQAIRELLEDLVPELVEGQTFLGLA
ncbi:MAG: glycosyltransferase [Verrucomicrobiota bacterium]